MNAKVTIPEQVPGQETDESPPGSPESIIEHLADRAREAEAVTIDSAESRSEPAAEMSPEDEAAELENDLYASTLRNVPLLTGDEEQRLGRTIQESRLSITSALGRIPAAVGVIVEAMKQAEARERPVTDAFFSPGGPFEDVLGEKAESEDVRWRDMVAMADRAYANWRACSADDPDPSTLARRRTRLEAILRSAQPGFPALREALVRCEALDDAVSAVETRFGGFHADILTGESAPEAARRLDTIRAEAGVDLTTLRECRRVAASAYDQYVRARERMITANLRLAYYMAHRLQGAGLSLDDLVQEAIFGLMRAVDKFDYRLGYKFSTYAVQWIRQSTTRAIADSSRTIRVAAHVHDEVVRLRRLGRGLVQRLGREPTVLELAQVSGLTEEKVEQSLSFVTQPLSLDAPLATADDSTLGSIVADAAMVGPDVSAHDAVLSRRVEGILDALPAREALIMRLRHGIGGVETHTLEEIGSMLGITRERTRQLEARAFARLRESIEPDMMGGLVE